MSKRSDKEFLSDVREAIHRIKAYTVEMNYDSFLDDTKTQDAVVRNLEIIGEAAKGVTKELREKYANVPWKSMSGVRDRLIHHYFGVNLDVVWEIISSELGEVLSQIENILKEMENKGQ